MKRFSTIASVVVAALLVAGPALASDGAVGEGPPLDAIGVHAINFLLMYGLLAFLLRKPIADALKQRQATIRQDLEDSAETRDAAQARYDTLAEKIAHFDDELAAMKADAAEDASKEREYMAERTERDAMMLREMTAGTIREETRRARTELQREAVDLAVKLAEERLRAEIGGGDQQRLAGEFLSAVKGEAHA